MVLQDIHDAVRLGLARGTAFDGAIPKQVALAAAELEQNKSYQYMEQFGEFTVDSTGDEPYVISLPDKQIVNVKEIKLLRFLAEDGTFFPLQRIDPEQMINRLTGIPDRYWLQGDNYIVLNKTPSQDLSYNLHYAAFTIWPNKDDATNWLIQNGTQALIQQTLFNFASLTRDIENAGLYAAQLDRALNTLNRADDELKYNDRDLVMNPTQRVRKYGNRIELNGLLSQ